MNVSGRLNPQQWGETIASPKSCVNMSGRPDLAVLIDLTAHGPDVGCISKCIATLEFPSTFAPVRTNF
jgi:hypothetical protein